MLTRRNLMLAAGAAGTALAAPAAALPSAQTFVAAIYNTYKGKGGNGVSFDTDASAARYFEPSLAALVRADQKDAQRRNETGKLDFDPFVDAQDWDIPRFNIKVTETASGTASANVTFANSGTPKAVALSLVKIGAEWRIADIIWPRNGKTQTLRGLLTA